MYLEEIVERTSLIELIDDIDIVKAVTSGNTVAVRRWLEAGTRDLTRLYDCGEDYDVRGDLILCFVFDPRGWYESYDRPRTDLLELLVANGADVCQLDPEGFSSLHVCHFPSEAAVLLDHGADIEAQSYAAKLTPLIMAARDGHFELVRFLLRSGANPYAVDYTGNDAEMFAKVGLSTVRGTPRSEALLREVKRAGSWKRYIAEPRIALVRLRLLCARFRAIPPREPVLRNLFGAPASVTTTAPRSKHPLPNEVVWHVLAYWRSSRDA